MSSQDSIKVNNFKNLNKRLSFIISKECYSFSISKWFPRNILQCKALEHVSELVLLGNGKYPHNDSVF